MTKHKNFTVKVGGVNYKVRWNEDVLAYRDATGETDHPKETIYLWPKGSQRKKEATFVHELLHACFFTSGLDHIINTEEEKLNTHEIIYILSPLLTQVLKDNKNLFKRLEPV